jgi:hypothetical protein
MLMLWLVIAGFVSLALLPVNGAHGVFWMV